MKTHLLENLIGCPLEETLAAISADTAALENFLATCSVDTLEHQLTPQWVVLAAGKGTRDRSYGTLEQNTGHHLRGTEYAPTLAALSARQPSGHRCDQPSDGSAY